MATTEDALPPAKVARVGTGHKSAGGGKKHAAVEGTEAMNVIIQFQTSTGESTGMLMLRKSNFMRMCSNAEHPRFPAACRSTAGCTSHCNT
jgi:hypothetical protein